MDRQPSDRFDEYLRDGYEPHYEHKAYLCGWCGHRVSSNVGLLKQQEWFPIDDLGICRFQLERRMTDVRICPECWIATTFLDNTHQIPGPIKGENLDARRKDDAIQLIVALYNEARISLSQLAPSCAVLMFRKLLMHIAVEQGAGAGLPFVVHINYLKENGIVGKPQHALLDRIRKEGNTENHDVVRATKEQADDLLTLVTLLVRSVYFSA